MPSVFITHTYVRPDSLKKSSWAMVQVTFSGGLTLSGSTRGFLSAPPDHHMSNVNLNQAFLLRFFSSIHSSTKTKQQLTKRLSVNEHLSLYTFRTLTRFSYQEKHPPHPQKPPTQAHTYVYNSVDFA